MLEFPVVLVEPKVEGNVGAVARGMANFGLPELVLVRPCPLGDEAYRRAKHGRPILEEAQTVETLPEALRGTDLSAATTGISSEGERAFHRQTLSPWELGERLSSVNGRVALVLGRENYGLLNEELSSMDLLVHIPCDPGYPVMNLSHAAAILFYELFRPRTPPSDAGRPLASGLEKEKLMEAFRELLEATSYPSHKRRKTRIMFRRLIGRALPTTEEFHALMGPLRRASKTVRRLSGSPRRGPSS